MYTHNSLDQSILIEIFNFFCRRTKRIQTVKNCRMTSISGSEVIVLRLLAVVARILKKKTADQYLIGSLDKWW